MITESGQVVVGREMLKCTEGEADYSELLKHTPWTNAQAAGLQCSHLPYFCDRTTTATMNVVTEKCTQKYL